MKKIIFLIISINTFYISSSDVVASCKNKSDGDSCLLQTKFGKDDRIVSFVRGLDPRFGRRSLLLCGECEQTDNDLQCTKNLKPCNFNN